MPNESIIKVFEGKNVRVVWNEEEEKYYFSVADIVEVLTESTDVKQYIKRMRSRDPELDSSWGTICTPTRMKAADGKYYKTQAADLEGIFRIIQSVPSKKAEPIKQWLAEIGAQRIDQMIDPEQTFQMAKAKYGTSLLTYLSKLLQAKIGRGYTRPNLNNMRKFYLTYPICQMSDKLTWSHICELGQSVVV